jgi:hypothetical protein
MKQPQSTDRQPQDDPHKSTPTSSHEKAVADDAPLQGEGNYAAARRYREEATRHAQSGDVEGDARRAEPADPAQAEELRRAEEEGKRHAKR